MLKHKFSATSRSLKMLRTQMSTFKDIQFVTITYHRSSLEFNGNSVAQTDKLCFVLITEHMKMFSLKQRPSQD